MKTKIVATEYNPSQAKGITQGSNVTISHETDNMYDENALKVVFNNEIIGYIGKGTDLYDISRDTFPMTGKVEDFYIKAEGDKFSRHHVGNLVSCNIFVEDIIELDPSDNVKSFNEEGIVVNFNEHTHTYTYDGVILKGATTFIKKYMKDFDSSFMIDRCNKSWGVPKKTIKEAWSLAGDLSASFGTGVHKALEFEDLYRHHTKKNGERCFTIKHPVISNIVKDFFNFYDKLGFEGEIIPEALVSDVENGLCALADRILVTSWEDKTCEIMDYKVNHSFDKKGSVTFINLPKEIKLETTKLSKLALQLKAQQRMLEKQGWTVTGLHGFVYDEKWKHYTVPRLDGFNILTGKMDS